MSEQIKIAKTIYSLDQFNNVVDTKFSQLANSSVDNNIEDVNEVNVDTFFDDYNTLFYDIPLSGSDNSHLGLVTKSLEYLGLSLEDLQNEIETLREENVGLKTQLLAASQINTGT